MNLLDIAVFEYSNSVVLRTVLINVMFIYFVILPGLLLLDFI